MSDILMHRPVWVGEQGAQKRALLSHEWLVTNGLGGYASGTTADVMTRKYHGYLIAALPSPFGRVVMLQDLGVTLHLGDGRDIPLSGEEREVTGPKSPGETIMRDFRLELGLPVWEFEVEGIRLEKRVVLPYGQNTVYVSFRLMNVARATLTLRPFIHFRSYEGTVKSSHPAMQCTQLAPSRLEIQAEGTLPPLRLLSPDAPTSYTEEMATLGEVAYRVEKDRGYEWVGEVKSPGAFQLTLSQDQPATLIASTELWAAFERIPFADAQEAERRRRRDLLGLAKAESDDTVERLVLAADQFVITPVGRPEDAARAKALGDETRTVIAGYHWFTDWGRDTMISLEGLTLATGRYREAGYILRTFAHYVRDGLIPNMFPDGANEGLYHTADATLWFFHAIDRYVKKTADRRTLDTVLPRLREIIACHVGGTRFGIGMDPSDSLLRQGAEGYQLTWMDAKVDGWVVTPRRGKAVEINALWYNAVRLLASFEREAKNAADAEKLDALAAVIRESFNKRFWNPEAGHLFDVIDGDGGVNDPACRPNQLLSISLEHPVLDESRWNDVIEVVRQRLVTPVGLRSLTPAHPEYKSRYFGDLRARDAAYHQGTVWAWLIGPFVDAWLRVHPDDLAGARAALVGLVSHMDDFGVGSVAEIFDADPPYAPRGCIAQAWSVAELLRAWRLTEPAPSPPHRS